VSRINLANLFLTLIIEFSGRIFLSIDISDTDLGIIISGSTNNDNITFDSHRKDTKTTVIDMFTDQVDATRRTNDKFRLTTMYLFKLSDKLVITFTKISSTKVRNFMLPFCTCEKRNANLPLLGNSSRIIDSIKRFERRYRRRHF
jgi:hypothetical protein